MLGTVDLTFLCETHPIHWILISNIDTDGLVIEHQGISSHSADYISMSFSAVNVLSLLVLRL